MLILNDRAEIAAAAGTEIGSSSWVEIGQDRIDMFADATGDRQWIHIDPERAADGPFGAMAPVRVGSKIRVRVEVLEVRDIEKGQQVTIQHTVEIKGSEKPACIAEAVTLLMDTP